MSHADQEMLMKVIEAIRAKARLLYLQQCSEMWIRRTERVSNGWDHGLLALVALRGGCCSAASASVHLQLQP